MTWRSPRETLGEMEPAVPSSAAGADHHAGRRELAIFALAYVTYFGVRALTEGRPGPAFRNAWEVIHFERTLGLDRERSIQTLATGSHVLRDVTNGVYIYGHWPVLIVAGILLFRYSRPQYRLLRDACLISGLIGLFIFMLFPVAPPRLTDLPVVDTVTLGSPGYRQLLPPSLVNQYAAMPSFHAGWNLLVGIVLFQSTRHWAVRGFAVAMPVAMSVAVVATANHYVVDVLAGAAIVLVALAAAHRIESRRARPTIIGRNARPTPDIGSDGEERTVPDRPSRGERPRPPALR